MPDPVRIACEIALPANFRIADALALHRRDPSEIAERVGADRFAKGIVWAGAAACLSVVFASGVARVELATDGAAGEGAAAALAAMARRMLGLSQRIEEFEAAYGGHPLLGPLIAANPGLRSAVAATPFEALSWAIVGQQVSVAAAVSMRRKLIEAVGPRHSGGLRAYPDAARIAACNEADLRAAGLSQAKARTLIEMSRRVVAGDLPLDAWADDPPAEEIRARLLAVRGIGPWTVDYALLRGYGWLDGSLHGDAAVRRNLQALLAAPERIDAEATRRWLAPFSPWRALVAAHLWAMKAPRAY